MKSKDIFQAARNGDVETVKSMIPNIKNINQTNDFNFTPLHCAAMGTNSSDMNNIIEIMHILIDAGSDIEQIGGGGRTALYLAAEFSPSIDPVLLLLDAGANPDITDEYENHIVVNSMDEEVQRYLSKITGFPIPKPKPELPKSKKMLKEDWDKTKTIIDKIFIALNNLHLITKQNSGTTQEDGFSDCAEIYISRGGQASDIIGFCFYTKQDTQRAKKTGLLPLAIWGAPEGADDAIIKVGNTVLKEFNNNGFKVYWDESAGMRPIIDLHSIFPV